MFKAVKNFWSTIRRLSGDDAYEQYLLHYQQHHSDVADSEVLPQPLSREEFFKQWQDEKWQGVKRCC
jgi:uncharacterized short protein YbdD (DUF466 family)